jgi:hypothetical protein
MVNQALFFGEHLALYRVLVIQLMGPSLEDLFEKCGKKFSLKTGRSITWIKMFCVLDYLWVSELWRPWKKISRRNKITTAGVRLNSQYLIMFIDDIISSSANSRSVDSESDGFAREINHSPRHQACKYNPHLCSFFCQSALSVKLLSTHRWSPLLKFRLL